MNILFGIYLLQPAQCYDGRDPLYIMSVFFEELQRRKVYRAAPAYIVAAGS